LAVLNPNVCPRSGACDNNIGTPLHMAVKAGNLQMCNLLIDNGAAPNVTDSRFGQTALHYSAIRGFNDITESLIAKGADVNYKDLDKKTALYYAKLYNHGKLAEYLVDQKGKTKKPKKHYRRDYLTYKINDESAAVWYLGHSGWGLRTANNFLIFDYWENNRKSDYPCLSNGWIDPEEIKDLNVTVFVSHAHGDHYDPVIYEWAEVIPNINYVIGFEPADFPSDRMEYFYTAPRTKTNVDGIEVVTIESNDTGVGFLIKVDDLTIYHAGDHANIEHDFSGPYLAEIDYLAKLKPEIDLAFMPIGHGCGGGDQTAVKLGVYKSLEILKPNVFFPMHSLNNEYRYEEFIEEAHKDGYKTQMSSPRNKGDRFLYKKGRIIS